MDRMKLQQFSRRVIVVWFAVFLSLVTPAFGADGTIDVIPDENVDGSVELTPGYIGGVVDIGGQAVNRIDLTAKGGDYSAQANLAAEGDYLLTVNVPKGGSLEYGLNGMAYMDNFNTRLYFKPRSTVVAEARTSVLNIIIDAGYLVGTITTEGCTIVQGELWAVLDNGTDFSRAYTKFGSSGSFRFPVQPNSNIRVYGQVQLSGGATYQLESKYIDVAPAADTMVEWHLLCGPGQPGAIDHHVDYHMNMDHHYSYLYYQGSWSPYKSVKHLGDVLFDNIAPGDWRLYTYSYWNSGRNVIAKYLDDITVAAGQTVPVDIDTVPGFLQGRITLEGTHTLADTTAAYLYGYGKNAAYPSYRTTSRAFVDSGDGAFNLALPHGDWDVFTSIYYFRNSDLNAAHLQSYLYMYDYKLKQNSLYINAGQTIASHNLTYETGSATIKYSRSDGGAFTRPYVNAKCHTYDGNNNLQEYIYAIAHGESNGDTVTFVGFPGTYDIEAWAYVDQSRTTFGKVTIEILPGVDKVVDIGGPQLIVQTPSPNLVTEAPTVVVSGMATDESGVKDVLVNGEPAQLASTNNPDDENEVSFSVEIELAEGDNRIETQAIDYSGNKSSDARTVTYTLPEQIHTGVSVDIKPGSCKNPFNLKSQGVLPVVILGSEDFNPGDIDPATVTLEGVAPVRWAIDDAASLPATERWSDDEGACGTDAPDGYDDLALKFDTRKIVAVLGEAADGDVVTLTLTGALQDGTEISGADIITVLKKGNQNTGKKK
jgi:hypothetical protein